MLCLTLHENLPLLISDAAGAGGCREKLEDIRQQMAEPLTQTQARSALATKTDQKVLWEG